MTAAFAFDTLSTARDLEAAGFERQQAEALASAVRQASAADRDALATKGDIAEIRADLASFATKGDIAEIRADLASFATKADLAGVRDELRNEIHRKTEALRSEMRWMLAFQGALILAVAARLFGIV